MGSWRTRRRDVEAYLRDAEKARESCEPLPPPPDGRSLYSPTGCHDCETLLLLIPHLSERVARGETYTEFRIPGGLTLSSGALGIMARAARRTSNAGRGKLGSVDILAAFLDEHEALAAHALLLAGVDLDKLRRACDTLSGPGEVRRG